jgi:uncharacterized protein with GYD domain
MPTYIVLLNLTQQGIQNVKEGPATLDSSKQRFQAIGAELKAFYLTMGRYDGVFIVDAPDDATLAKRLLDMGSHGIVRSETLRAFTEEEYRKIIAELP